MMCIFSGFRSYKSIKTIVKLRIITVGIIDFSIRIPKRLSGVKIMKSNPVISLSTLGIYSSS